MTRALPFALAAILAAPGSAAAQDKADAIDKDPTVRALRAELARAKTLRLPSLAQPYHVSFAARRTTGVTILSEFGGLVDKRVHRARGLRVAVRVGDYKIDNSGFIGGGRFRGGGLRLPLDDNYNVIRRAAWLAADRAYKRAVEAFEAKRAAHADRPRDADHAGDYTKAPAIRVVVAGEPPAPDAVRYETLGRRLTALFWDYPAIQEGHVHVAHSASVTTYVSTDGSLVRQPSSRLVFTIAARAQALDGAILKAYDKIVVPSAADLPADDKLVGRAKAVLTEISRRRLAPVGEAYNGPVLFEGAAAARLLAEVLVPHLSGTPPLERAGPRQPRGTELAGRVGKPVLPAGFRVVDDPTLTAWRGQALVGHYRVDTEGVVAQKVDLITNGKLKGFLMSRTPRKDFPKSNGHGRFSAFGRASASIGNLVVSVRRGLSTAKLKRKLIAAAKAAGEDHAIIIRQLDDSATARLSGDGAAGMPPWMRRSRGDLPRPRIAVKVGLDGKETPLRGLRLKRLPVSALRRIVAAGRSPYVYNIAGAGASIVVPALLLPNVDIGVVSGSRRPVPLLARPTKN